MAVFGQKLIYSGKSGCVRAKLVLYGEKWFISGKRCCGGCIRTKWLRLGISGCIYFIFSAVQSI